MWHNLIYTYRIGKKNIIQILSQNGEISNKLLEFKNPNTDHTDLTNIGIDVFLLLYGSPQNFNLNDEKYFKYKNPTSEYNLSKDFELTILPQTTDAAILYIQRTYYQIQSWLGRLLDPEEWGWKT